MDIGKKTTQKYKIILLFGAVILVAGIFRNTTDDTTRFKNFILIGWDGVQREHLYQLLHEGKLPNLKKFITFGSMSNINITTGKTQTKPGWSEILTGYDSKDIGIVSNFDYKPIPKGYTVFERLENYFGKENITTLFVGGKVANIGARGPHKICTNCLRRFPDTRRQTWWWDENTSAPTVSAEEERTFVTREGEPYYYTKDSLDVYEVALGMASNVGARVIDYIEKYKDKRFFAFFHFEEPDEPGHRYGENSKEYSDGIISNDYWLGKIISHLMDLGIYEETLIYVTSDHGFDEGKTEHSYAPNVFLATNDSLPTKKEGDRKDITPTILQRYGIDIKSLIPSLDGASLVE